MMIFDRETEGSCIKPWVLIPAYEPDERLFDLTQKLCGSFPVLIVDDGSRGDGCGDVFAHCEAAGAVVLRHSVNLGKGAALKTGIAHLQQLDDDSPGVITADADGQHTPEDIAKLADALAAHPNALILGARDFSKMPLRSKAGNTITRFVYRLATDLPVTDTQTGLRAMPKSLYPKLLELGGERYEYEMNMLLALKSWEADFFEVKIATIYIDNNSSTHFHALRDGIRVFSRVLRYIASSLISTVVDYALYIGLIAVGLEAMWAFAASRAVSSVINYELNCRVVFSTKPGVYNALAYAALVAFVMLVGSPAVQLLSRAGMNEVLAKLIVDVVLFAFNYFMQKYFVFKKKKRAA